MDPAVNSVLALVIGPYGALALSIAVIVFLWRRLEKEQETSARRDDLFEEALRVIRDANEVLAKELAARRR